MAIIRRSDWDPFRELHSLQRGLNDLFDWSWGKGALERSAEGISWAPAVEVDEDEKEIRVKAEVPGMTKDDLNISLDGNVLRISGEKKTETTEGKGKKKHVCEICYGKFERMFTLPETADDAKVNAAFKDGILNVTIGKKKAPTPEENRH